MFSNKNTSLQNLLLFTLSIANEEQKEIAAKLAIGLVPEPKYKKGQLIVAEIYKRDAKELFSEEVMEQFKNKDYINVEMELLNDVYCGNKGNTIYGEKYISEYKKADISYPLPNDYKIPQQEEIKYEAE